MATFPDLKHPMVMAALALCLPSNSLAADPSSGQPRPDAELIRILLDEGLDQRRFEFSSVIKAATGHKVIPFTDNLPSHRRLKNAIDKAITDSIRHLNRDDSPVRKLRRINEASRYFEDDLLKRLNETKGLQCGTPQNRSGQHQRSGYPDLRIVDVESGLVCYLDPKLVEKGSESSTLRTFYYEPKEKTGKITEDAVHLLLGITHDGQDGAWVFEGWNLLDLSTTRLRLKAEFQSSNSDLYQNSILSSPAKPE